MAREFKIELISLVMMNGVVIIGTASYCASDSSVLRILETVSLYLLPDYYGNGYGRQLLQAAVDGLAEKGYTSLSWVWEENKSQALEKFGFRTVEAYLRPIGGKI